MQGAHRGRFQGCGKNILALDVADFQVEIAVRRGLIVESRARAQDRLEVNRIAGTIHRPVRVHVGGQRACSISAHPVRPRRADRKIVFGPGHDLYVFRARLLHINLGKAILLRDLLADLIAIYKEEGLRLSRRLARLPV